MHQYVYIVKEATMDTKNAPAVLRGVLCSIIVLSLPTGVGVALIALASALPWRLAALRGISSP